MNDPHVGGTTYTYDDVGNLRGFTYPNGVNTFCEYNALNRLTNMNVSAGLTPVANYAYALMASGHRTGASETRFVNPLNPQPITLTRLYQYDRTYRLTNETIGGTSYASPATLDFSYDRMGNRLQLASTQPGIVSQLSSYDANDRLLSDSYDSNGNTLTAPGFNQAQPDQYDFENRLVRRTETGKTVTIVYDGDGNRAQKIVTTATNTVTTWFLVDTVNLTGYAQVLEETTDTANPQLLTPQVTRTYSYGHDLISQQQSTGSGWQLSFFGYDGHGNVRFLTDQNAFVTDTYDYDAFGNLIARTGSAANNYLFTGEQLDPDLGLYFLRARYQNTQTGRFWTMDEWEGVRNDPPSLHKYLYAHDDPVNGSDPSGHETLKTLSIKTAITGTLARIGIQNLRVVVKKGTEVLVCVAGRKLLTEGTIHHIATNKNWKKGGKWSEKFDELFDDAELSLNTIFNKIVLKGHKGPHPEKYHEEIYNVLKEAVTTAGANAEAIGVEVTKALLEEALEEALLKLASRLCKKYDPLTKMIVGD